MTGRRHNAGVTLVEMLVALTISALIGVAGFALLEGVTRAEASVSGRLARLEAQDRAFRLLTLDLANATHMRLNEVLDVQVAGHLITWQASGTGIVRVLTDANGQVVRQGILNDPAILSNHAPGVISLKLPESDVWRLVPFAALPLE
ncbi:prepilin-type N-terminal cleavage/methylation domain-containing protein [Tateyamaria sp. syn59]|uniref:prepilin-type N-terminal cleavage/methylation domain-containing protein n=1 Tax=Tateyamaria sp. syn59 TaxID=2576942 RepID=UPI0011BE28ED|nr:prepilin-type N-terminal cleavage/methylation domain-containing protein [Tateyamaria sp. syn59]